MKFQIRARFLPLLKLMTLSDNWQKAYTNLVDFIATHPAITLDSTGVSIPSEVRDEFYRRFDDARRGFVEDNYSVLPPELAALSAHYMRLEKEVCNSLSLEGISLPIDLFTFLHSPTEGLMRALYNRLFDLLQSKISVELFDQAAVAEIQASAADLLRLGYEMWMALSVVKILDPE